MSDAVNTYDKQPSGPLSSNFVRLTSHELLVAQLVAVARHTLSQSRGYTPVAGQRRNLRDDVLGATGELAFAKRMGLWWPGLSCDGPDADDVAGYHVRSVSGGGRLIIREGDVERYPSETFVLVTQYDDGQCSIDGGITPREVIDHPHSGSWWLAPGGRPGAWFVPRDALSDVVPF